MNLKGKVASVSKSWDSMYPAMAAEQQSGKARVEIEIHGGGRVCLDLPTKDAEAFPFGGEVNLVVEPVKAAGSAARAAKE